MLAFQELDDLRELDLTPDHRRRGHGQVRPVEALERRKVSLAELVDTLGRRKILEAVLAEVEQRQPVARSASAAVAAETSTWPPWPEAAMRAARWTSAPTYPSSVRSGVPVCRPMRTWTLPELSLSTIARDASSAPGAVGNAKKNASPWVSTSAPPCSAHDARTIRRCSASAGRVLLGAELVEKLRRALDVGEEEGDGARRKIGAHGEIMRRTSARLKSSVVAHDQKESDAAASDARSRMGCGGEERARP